MVDLMQEKTCNWMPIFATSSVDENIDNLVHTITADIACSDAYKADLKSLFNMLVETSQQ